MSDIVKLIWQKLWAQQQKLVLRIYLVIFHSKKQHLQKCIGTEHLSIMRVLAYFLKVKLSCCLTFQRRKSRRKKKWNILSSSNGDALFCVQKFCVTEVNWKDVLLFSFRKATHASHTTGICNSSDFIKDFSLDFFLSKHNKLIWNIYRVPSLCQI